MEIEYFKMEIAPVEYTPHQLKVAVKMQVDGEIVKVEKIILVDHFNTMLDVCFETCKLSFRDAIKARKQQDQDKEPASILAKTLADMARRPK